MIVTLLRDMVAFLSLGIKKRFNYLKGSIIS